MACLIETQCGLRQVGHPVRIGHVKFIHVLWSIHDLGNLWGFAESANDLVVIAVANKNQRVPFARELYRLHVDLGHKRAGRVNHPQLTQLARLTHFRSDTMSAVDDTLASRDLLDAVHEDGALGDQLVHDITVVDDLLADVNRRSEGLKRNANDINGADDSGAEAPGLQQKQGLGITLIHFLCASQYTGKYASPHQLLYCNSAGISNVTAGEWRNSAPFSENLAANGAALNRW